MQADPGMAAPGPAPQWGGELQPPQQFTTPQQLLLIARYEFCSLMAG